MDELTRRRLDVALTTRGVSSQPIRQLAIRLLVERCAPGASLLDFGAGGGALLGQLAERGLFGQLSGVDIQPRPACPNRWRGTKPTSTKSSTSA